MTRTSGRSRLVSIGLPLVGLACLALGIFLVTTNQPTMSTEPPPRRPLTPPPAAAATGTGGLIGAVGTSEPAGEPIAIAAQVAGVVELVEARVGATVAKGDLLFRVDQRRAAAEVAARQAEIDAAVADREALRATIGPREAAITSARAAQTSAEARVLEMEADLADRQNKLDIGERLLRTSVVTSEEVDNRRFSMRQAAARVATAKAAVAEAAAVVTQARAELARLVDTSGGAGPDILAADKRIELARREFEKATAELAQFSVLSPVAGRILQVNVRPGEFAPASVPTEGLVVIGRDGPTHLRVEIDEVDILRFRPDLPAWATPRGGGGGTRLPLTYAYVEPLVVPKRGLSGRTTDVVDTRVLQVVYTLGAEAAALAIGQQYDVFITPAPAADESAESAGNPR